MWDRSASVMGTRDLQVVSPAVHKFKHCSVIGFMNH